MSKIIITDEMNEYIKKYPFIGRRKFAKIFSISENRARVIVNTIKYENGIEVENKLKNDAELYVPKNSDSLEEAEWNTPEDINQVKKIEIYKIDPQKFLDEAIRRQDFNKEVDSRSTSIEIEVELKKSPDGDYADFIALGDLHFGDWWTDYRSLSNVLKEVKEKDYNIAFLGDQKNHFLQEIKGNFIPVLNQILTPEQQVIWSVNLFREFIERKQILVIIEGNHDKRPALKTGIDFMKIIDWTVPIMHNRCMLTVKFGGRSWKGLLSHKEGSSSQWNVNHAASKALRMKYPRVDFIVTAHTHVPGYQEVAYDGKMVPLIQLGTFNSDSDYAKSVFGSNDSFIYYPILRFDPNLESPLYFRGFYYPNFKK